LIGKEGVEEEGFNETKR